MQSINDQINVFELGVNEETKDNLGGISQWMQISAIIAFISTGVSLISAMITYSKLSAYSFGGGAAGSSLGTSLFTAAISVALNLLLIQAASNVKKGLAQSDQGYLNAGLSKMATYFKVFGILVIIALSFMILAIFFSALMR